jgi:hypothetical protein
MALKDSSFYCDGFDDGIYNRPASPPAPYSFAGNTTTVYASEYLQGWAEGRREYREHLATRNDSDSWVTGTNDSNADCNHC